MKKILIIFCLVFVSSGTFAQYYSNGQSPFSWLVTTSGAVAFFQLKSSAASPISNSAIPIGCAGVGFDYKFNDYFSISPAILLSGKGGKTEGLYGNFGADITTEYQLGYLEESLCFIGHIPIGYQANIFLGSGPYNANGIFGSTQTNYSLTDQKIKFGKNGDFQSYDYGISSLIGFQTEQGYMISLNFDLGLSYIHQTDPGGINYDQFKNRSFYLSFGRNF